MGFPNADHEQTRPHRRPPIATTVAGLVFQAFAWVYVAVYLADPNPPRDGGEGAFNALSGAVLFGIIAVVLLAVAALRCTVMKRSDAAPAPGTLHSVFLLDLVGIAGVVVIFVIAATAPLIV